jgi:NADH dehydrogenase [ubiquinone] 1 alpha subcomplex assembly factor 7
MRAMQQANITNGDRTNVEVHWHNTIKEIPPSSTEYTMLVAHEFFDALSIRVLQVIQSFPSFKRVCANLLES